MNLNSFYDNKENYGADAESGFSSRTTGCSCCSKELTTEKEVKEASIGSLVEVLKAVEYFGWDMGELAEAAVKQRNKELDEREIKELEGK